VQNAFGTSVALNRDERATAVLKISILDTPNQRRLMLEGRLIAPWAAEVRSACKAAEADLHDRTLVIDLKNLTAISEDGENVLLELLCEGIKFRCSGVFTKHVLKQLARRTRQNRKETRQ
jgi:hypothetical protein